MESQVENSKQEEVAEAGMIPHVSPFMEHALTPPDQPREWRVCKANSDHPEGSTSFDEIGNQYVYVSPARYKQIEAHENKRRAQQFCLQENGVVIVTDNRIKPGDYSKLQVDCWICNPDSYDQLKTQVESRGLRVREISEKERARLTHKAKVKIDTELRLHQIQKRNGFRR